MEKVKEKIDWYLKIMNIKSDNLSTNLRTVLIMFLVASISYFISFISLKMYDLAIVSIVGVFTYIFCIKTVGKNELEKAFFIAHIQILFSSSISVLILGWGYGFQIILIALISIMYIDIFRNRLISYILVLSESIIYIALYLVHISNEGEQSVSYYQDYFYVANFIFLIVMLLIISKILKSTDIAYFYQLKDDNDKFKNASETDDLTGLINKRTLNLIIDNKRRSSMVISMCDIDNFKQINDQFGHNTGDLVLKTLSNIFLDHTNKTDIVCRWGGEEFVIVSFDISKNDFLTKIQKIKFQISETIIKEGNETFNFSVTFGVSEVGNDRNLLIKQADKRLYKGKNSTKNCIVSK